MFGVSKNKGVKASDVISGVGVPVFTPTSVGVCVKVEVGIVGVRLGISVGIFVAVVAGVGAANGADSTQEKDRTAKIR